MFSNMRYNNPIEAIYYFYWVFFYENALVGLGV